MRNLFRSMKSLMQSKPRFEDFYDAEYPVDLAQISEFRGDAFPKAPAGCWLDAPDALLRIKEREKSGELSHQESAMCMKFLVDGYFIAEGLIENDLLDSVWAIYEEGIRRGYIQVNSELQGQDDPFPGRSLDPHLRLHHIRDLQWHPAIFRITDLLLGRRTLPFQTIMGHKGSQQRAHSDAIHMTTYPLGLLIANWIAFEDIHPDSGPLFFYPKSHRMLPYLLSGEVGNAAKAFKRGIFNYSQYEETVQNYIDAHELVPEFFVPRKGDVLFWHSNLLHGGSQRRDLRHSRKAAVCHYFGERAVTYHDLSGNLSRLHRNGIFSAPVTDRPLQK